MWFFGIAAVVGLGYMFGPGASSRRVLFFETENGSLFRKTPPPVSPPPFDERVLERQRLVQLYRPLVNDMMAMEPLLVLSPEELEGFLTRYPWHRSVMQSLTEQVFSQPQQIRDQFMPALIQIIRTHGNSMIQFLCEIIEVPGHEKVNQKFGDIFFAHKDKLKEVYRDFEVYKGLSQKKPVTPQLERIKTEKPTQRKATRLEEHSKQPSRGSKRAISRINTDAEEAARETAYARPKKRANTKQEKK